MLCTRLKHKHKAKVGLQHGTPKQGRLMRSRSRPAAAMSSPFKRLRLSPVAERLQERDNRDVVTDGWNERQRMWRTNETKQRESKENFVGGSQVSSGKESGFHDVPSGSEQARRTGYKARGQLKVAVSIDKGLMTVHVVQARLLQSERQTLCNSYIQVFLSPDVSGRTCCRSEVVYDTNNPQINEKFTYELMGEDSRKRLTILVWNKDCRNNSTEILGCMSFGMRHLLSKAAHKPLVVDGWYHLLGEKLGMNKHLQIPCASSRGQGNLDVDGRIMTVNASLQGMDAHTLIIERGNAGYGFTVTGSCPVKVGSVRVWGAAHEAGLQEGDFFVRINGLNVSRSSVESVAKIVRLSESKIIVDIQRGRPTGPVATRPARDRCINQQGHVYCTLRRGSVESSEKRQPSVVSRERSSGSSSHTQSISKSSVVNSFAPVSSSHSISASDPNIAVLSVIHSVSRDNVPPGEINRNRDQPPPDVSLDTQLLCRPEPTRHSEAECVYSSREQMRWDPFMSPILGSESFRIPFIESSAMESTFDESLADMSLPCQPDITVAAEERRMAPSQSFRVNGLLVNSVSVGNVTVEQSWLPRQPNCTLASLATDTESERSGAEDWEGSKWEKPVTWEKGRTTGDGTKGGSLMCSTPEPSSGRGNFTDDSEIDLERKLVIHDVINCEDNYITQMHRGMQRFSRPLRHCIVSSKQHATLFQNVEKLVVISQYHLGKILDLSGHMETSQLDDSEVSATQEVFTDDLATVYISNMGMFCAAYVSYRHGLDQALQLLRQLTEMPDFARFLHVSSPESGLLDIEEFLKQPTRHLKELLSHLKRLHQFTGPGHSDYNNLKEVIKVLEETLVPTTNVMPSEKATSLGSRTCHRSRDSLLTPSHAMTNIKSKSLSSLGSLDTDVIELQNHMTFGQGVKHFQVAAPNRHLIFSGNLLWLHGATCRPVWVILLSDMLLLTRRGTGSHLVVIEEPLNLCDIVKTQFNMDHPSQFSVCCTSENSQRSEGRTYVLRALDMEQKCTWKTILEHRRNTCQQSREPSLQIMGDNIFI